MAANGNLILNLSSLVVGSNYTVMSATNLTPPVVWNAETNFTATATSGAITNAMFGADQKYYRVSGY